MFVTQYAKNMIFEAKNIKIKLNIILPAAKSSNGITCIQWDVIII